MSIIDVPEAGAIKQRFSELETVRNKYRDRAREYAKVTIPFLVPEVENTDTIEFQNDYNTEGAKLVSNLANSYVETLFPAGRSFIKLNMPAEDYVAHEQEGRSKTDIDSTFAIVERDFRTHFDRVQSRPTMLEGLLQLIVTGNVCLYKAQDGMLQSYAIDEYVVLRSLDGTLLELITEDKKYIGSLSPELRAEVIADMQLDEDDIETEVTLYTYVRRDPENPDTWYVDQAVEATPVGEQNTYSTEKLRWIPVMWTRTRREMYGRGLVEQHYGSLWTLSILSEALAVGCVTLSDIKYLVRPGSMVDIKELNESASGTYHYGDVDDINAISTDRARDMQLIEVVLERYKRHLAEVFMFLPGTMRDAERVTAEENRLRARSLEQAHGGVYSSLAVTMQKPYARLLLEEMNVKGLSESGVSIDITTGIDALSRGNENDRINHWFADLAAANNIPPHLQPYFRSEDFLKTTASGRDVDHSKLLNTEEEVQAQMAAQQEAQAQNIAGEAMVKNADAQDVAQAMQR
jgi:hypothetical protein